MKTNSGKNSEFRRSIPLFLVCRYFLRHLCLFAAKIPRSERLDLPFNKCALRNVISRHCVTEFRHRAHRVRTP